MLYGGIFIAFIRHLCNDFTLHRSDKTTWAAPLNLLLKNCLVVSLTRKFFFCVLVPWQSLSFVYQHSLQTDFPPFYLSLEVRSLMSALMIMYFLQTTSNTRRCFILKEIDLSNGQCSLPFALYTAHFFPLNDHYQCFVWYDNILWPHRARHYLRWLITYSGNDLVLFLSLKHLFLYNFLLFLINQFFVLVVDRLRRERKKKPHKLQHY